MNKSTIEAIDERLCEVEMHIRTLCKDLKSRGCTCEKPQYDGCMCDDVDADNEYIPEDVEFLNGMVKERKELLHDLGKSDQEIPDDSYPTDATNLPIDLLYETEILLIKLQVLIGMCQATHNKEENIYKIAHNTAVSVKKLYDALYAKIRRDGAREIAEGMRNLVNLANDKDGGNRKTFADLIADMKHELEEHNKEYPKLPFIPFPTSR